MANGTGTATLDFGTGDQYATVSVTGQSGCTTGAACEAWIMRDTTADHSDYEHMIVPVDLRCGSVNGSGFTIAAVADFPLTGQFKCRWVWHQAVSISCSYALNDDGTVAAMFGGVAFDSYDATRQIVTHTYQSGIAANRVGLQSTFLTGEAYSGTVAMEVHISIPSAISASNQDVAFVAADTTALQAGGIIIRSNGEVIETISGSEVVIASGVAQNGSVIGLYVNNATGQCGATVNGIDYGYLGSIGPAGDSYSFYLSSSNPNSASDVGKTITLTLVSNASDMTQPFPAGAKDPCGNTI